jgi:hypothetical protein
MPPSEQLAFSIPQLPAHCKKAGAFCPKKEKTQTGVLSFKAKKMVDHFRLIRKIFSCSNACELINHGHISVNLLPL